MQLKTDLLLQTHCLQCIDTLIWMSGPLLINKCHSSNVPLVPRVLYGNLAKPGKSVNLNDH